MTPEQLPTLKAAIMADTDPAVVAARTDRRDQDIATLYNADASPDFWLWRHNVSRAEIYHKPSVDATSWNWTTFKNQSQGEQGSWVQMFMGDQADFGPQNFRDGVVAIFTGSGAQQTQRDHIFAAGKRKGSKVEKLYANVTPPNTGAKATPALVVLVGPISGNDVSAALNLP